MGELQEPVSPDQGPMPGSGLRLTVLFGVVVAGAWLLIDVVLHLQLTQVLSAAIAVTGAEWIMYLLIGLSVLSMGVTIERWLFYRGRQIDIQHLRERFSQLLNAGRKEEAMVLAQSLPSMAGHAVTACLRCPEQTPAAMERELTATLARERLEYERYLIILGTLGNSAPFIGLFGTVLGIIKAFMDLAQDMAGGAAVVMAGISEALVATALGLLVAIPSVVAYNALKAKVKGIGTDAEYLAHVVITHAATAAKAPHGDDME